MSLDKSARVHLGWRKAGLVLGIRRANSPRVVSGLISQFLCPDMTRGHNEFVSYLSAADFKHRYLSSKNPRNTQSVFTNAQAQKAMQLLDFWGSA